MIKNKKLIGPFTQLLPMSGLPIKGALSDEQIVIVQNGGILVVDGIIEEVGDYDGLIVKHDSLDLETIRLEGHHVGLPGWIDAHTHICFAGSRAVDYALRNAGKTYLDIAKAGGGIWDTVTKTRRDSQKKLTGGIINRAGLLLSKGVTTIEVKSGYGLSVNEELKMLRAIKDANNLVKADLISTCLAAHIFPKDYHGTIDQYLSEIVSEVFPIIKTENLANRVDAFIEEEAFNAKVIQPYLEAAGQHGFHITIHADQFHTGGSDVAIKHGAISADHLEASTDREIELLAQSGVIATALPGASIGLGMGFTPARKILDAGGALSIASDYNPGSAPMGDLLTVAAILGTFEKLSAAEVLSGLTFRAATALNLKDRGRIVKGKKADIISFATGDYREILYHQGQMMPNQVWKGGKIIRK